MSHANFLGIFTYSSIKVVLIDSTLMVRDLCAKIYLAGPFKAFGEGDFRRIPHLYL